MCIRHEETGQYLMDSVGLSDLVVDALIEEDTRSRVRIYEDGIMVLLRTMSVNCGEMSAPEDMVSIRVWIDQNRVITTREADVDPIQALVNRIADGNGPMSTGEFLSDLIEEHLNEINPYIEQLEDDVNNIDTMVTQHEVESVCSNMAQTQRRISGFLRHLRPQKPVLEKLSASDHSILGGRNSDQLDDSLNQLLRYLETLENLRERVDILNDQITRIQDRQLNRSSYAFAVAATIFLPLTFVTGLFGTNLMGIPLSELNQGFFYFTLFCSSLIVGMIMLFKWKKWL